MRTILVVEDEPVVAQDIKERLKTLGYTVPHIVSSGEGAIQKAEEIDPDLVLMDIVLKGEIDGIEAANRLRDLDIPVIFLTAYADEKTLKRAKITEPFGYILKPFEDRELKAAIEIAIYKHEIERKIRESEQWLSTILRSINEAVIATDKKGVITFMNPMAEALTRWSHKEASGRPLPEVFVINSDNQPPFMEMVFQEKDVRVQLILFPRRGKELPIEAGATPIKGEDTIGFVLVFRDITEQIRAEEALKRAERKFRDIFENANDAIFIHDLEGHILEVNTAAVERLGYTKEKLLQMVVADVDSPQHSVFYQARIDELERTGHLFFETVHRVKDGREIITEVNSRLIEFEEKPAVLSIARDITERKKAIEELERIAWLITKSLKLESAQMMRKGLYEQPYGNLVGLNRCRLLVDSVGEDGLAGIVSGYLDLLETSAAIYEKNGDYALGIFASGWCRFLDQASRTLCNTEDNREALDSGKWLCHESCWNESSKVSMEMGSPSDIECKGGIHLYAVPIWAGGEVVGSINVGYGDPPTDPGKLKEIAERYNVTTDELTKHAESYESRPPFMVDLAKSMLVTSAQLIGTLVERKQAEKEKDRILHGLDERIKELNCLYRIDEIERRNNITIEEMLEETAAVVPSALQHPEIAGCRIRVLDKEYRTELFTNTQWMVQADITVNKERSGEVEICYLENWTEDECPFLKEERELIASIATRLGEFIEGKMADQALRQAEIRFQTLFENVPVGVGVATLDGHVLASNDTLLEMTGFTKEELETINVRELYQHPEEREILLTQLEKERFIHDFEVELKRKDGTLFYASVNVALGTLGGGEVLLTTVNDITRQKEAEKALQESEKELKILFEASRLMNSTMDTDEIFGFISDSIQKLVGFDDFILFLVSEDEQKIYPAHAAGRAKTMTKGLAFNYGEGPVGRCIAGREPLLVAPMSGDATKAGGESQIFIPLMSEKRSMGALHLSRAAPHFYHQRDVAVLQPLSEVISSALKNSQLHNQIKLFNLELERKVSEKSMRTEILLDIKQRLQAEKSWKKGLTTLVETMERMGFERSSIFLVNPLRKTLDFHFGKGTGLPEAGPSVSLRDTAYFGARCIEEKRIIFVKDPSKEGKEILPGAHSFVWVPIIVQDEALAAIAAGNTSTKPITDDDIKDLGILAGMCAAFIDRTRTLVDPVAEEILETEVKHWLDPAESYIVLEKKPEKSLEIFSDLVTHGVPGFAVSRVHPEKLKRKYSLVKTPFLWLTRTETKDSLSPEDLPKLSFIIDDFTRKSKESVILLDGLEYLIAQNSFDTILKFTHELKDIIVFNNSRLIVPLHKDTLSQKEYSILEREFMIIEQGKGG